MRSGNHPSPKVTVRRGPKVTRSRSVCADPKSATPTPNSPSTPEKGDRPPRPTLQDLVENACQKIGDNSPIVRHALEVLIGITRREPPYVGRRLRDSMNAAIQILNKVM